MELKEAEEKALKASDPDYFVYYGDLDKEVWGTMFSVHRDSDVLERSNWITICKEMEQFGSDFWVTESFSHWAVGWCECGRIRIRWNGEYTEAFKHAVELANQLEDYPVLDESHYSEMEYEEFYEFIDNEWSYHARHLIDYEADTMPEDFTVRVVAELSDQHCNADDVSSKALDEAVEEAYIKWKLEGYEQPNQEVLV